MESKFYKKWWFWAIVILSIVSISSTILLIISNTNQSIPTNTSSTNRNDIYVTAAQIQSIYENATLYRSAGGNTLILELKNFNMEESYLEFDKMINIIKENVKDQLSSYKELVIMSYMNDDDGNNSLAFKTTYSLPNFIKNDNESCNYINYEQYTELYNTYENAMDSYKELFTQYIGS